MENCLHGSHVIKNLTPAAQHGQASFEKITSDLYSGLLIVTQWTNLLNLENEQHTQANNLIDLDFYHATLFKERTPNKLNPASSLTTPGD